ncbi:MAG TPA: hypothetical protein VHZ50_12305 [Puia sp.]|jgi:hypothetical protein|nr:hypothetical protein [Puia sp.]
MAQLKYKNPPSYNNMLIPEKNVESFLVTSKFENNQKLLMKNCFLVILISIFAVQCLYAQKDSSKNSLSFSIGPSIPVGSFAGTDFSKSSSGFAKIGEAVNFSFDHKLSEHLSFTVMWYGQRNGLNTKTFQTQLATNSAFFWDLSSSEPRRYPNWVVDKKSWYVGSLQIGITEEMPFSANSKISFIAKALIGGAYVQLPKLHAQSFSDTSYVVLQQNGASAFGLSYTIGAGLKYKLNKKFNLIFDADYFGTTQISFKNVTQTVAATNGGLNVPGIYSLSNSVGPPMDETQTGANKQSIGSVIVNFGIELRL